MSSKKCFFIDDDADDREFFCTAVAEIDSSIECVFAKNGVAAIEQFHTDPSFTPDYIFIDMNMPLMDGRECLQNIKSLPRLKDIPVYIYTTATSPRVIEEIVAEGAMKCLIKPSNLSEMIATLKAIISPDKYETLSGENLSADDLSRVQS